jgi:hypothetical protein
MPQADKVMVEKARHDLTISHSAAVANALLKFFNGTQRE